ncbi:ubiquinol-cytochrome C chaperone family protein [Sphingomicrobium clamense]|uniref:Ubiquinol-cytochrome C chaperone n=1 Tax=Sphingomicrobium clamense TaxID=2851013 RepID=A0ABS6V2U3_9SPHN|nr:ubiquinol-cytochrome C chaperone family protein [Sphingomicrobium sp. B8]MBW0143879.1 ubiquinol-cytochrome C chaperone [Sphingomicrobium sp. B8]
MRSLLNMFARPKAEYHSLYEGVVAAAREADWYRGGKVPDTLDGRFAVLSTLLALTILRMEQGEEETVRASVHLTEAFIADMDAQMREEGFGDPSLGKQVRSLVGALAARVDRWRPLAESDRLEPGEALTDAVRFSLYRYDPPEEAAETLVTEKLRRFHEGLGGASDRKIMAGQLA